MEAIAFNLYIVSLHVLLIVVNIDILLNSLYMNILLNLNFILNVILSFLKPTGEQGRPPTQTSKELWGVSVCVNP